VLGVPTIYSITCGGKRLRPLICMLSAELVGGDYRLTKEAFLALELIHNGTLVHDDILDGDLYRRGTPSLQVKFGGKRAILTGDALLSLGLKYAAKTGNLEIVELLSETALKMIQGVALQTLYRRKIVSEESYMNINYLKSGSLFEAAAAIGGLIASKNKEDTEKLAEFGKCFGNAYQIRDDVCGVYSEDRNDELTRNDLLNGDVSLPLIYALESDKIKERDRFTITSTHLGTMKRADQKEIQRIYEETTAVSRSIERMKAFAEKGRMWLEGFEENYAKGCLSFLLDHYYKNFNPLKKVEAVI